MADCQWEVSYKVPGELPRGNCGGEAREQGVKKKVREGTPLLKKGSNVAGCSLCSGRVAVRWQPSGSAPEGGGIELELRS